MFLTMGKMSVFVVQASTLDERRNARKQSLENRVNKVIELIETDPDASWLYLG